jgi:WD40 repeat protein
VSRKDDGFFSVLFTRKGDVMVTGTAEGRVQFWDLKTLGLYK